MCPIGTVAGSAVQQRAQYGLAYQAAEMAATKLGDIPAVFGGRRRIGRCRGRAGGRGQIVVIDGAIVRPSPLDPRMGVFAPTAAVLDALGAAFADGEAMLQIRRGTAITMVTVIPKPACHARFDVRAGQSANAISDGAMIEVSSDLIAEAQGDPDLAAILAHELALNVLRYPQRRCAREAGLSVRTSQIEADRLSVYLLDAAGYGAAGAEVFWSRLGRAHDLGILSDGSHPSWWQRTRSSAPRPR